MNNLGFKRTGGDWFVRQFNDTEQKIGFSHATYSEKHVKYYAIHIHLICPKIQEIIDALGILVFPGLGIEIGYLMPEKRYYEWRIAESDSDSYVEKVVVDMVSKIRKHVIPHIEKYSTINNVIKGFEDYELKSPSNDKYLMPILYYLEGDMEGAVKYIEQTFQSMNQFFTNRDVEFMQDLYGESSATLRENKEYVLYKEFMEKFKSFIKRNKIP